MPLKIYLYYPGTDSAYVDDFVIQYFEKPDLDWLFSSGTNTLGIYFHLFPQGFNPDLNRLRLHIG